MINFRNRKFRYNFLIIDKKKVKKIGLKRKLEKRIGSHKE